MQTNHHKIEENKIEESFISHLIELRRRLIYILVAVLVVFLILMPFSAELFTSFAKPVLTSLSANENLIIRKPLDSFLIPLKLSLFLAVIFTLPWILYQIWLFLKPAMYKNEEKTALPLVISTTFLFYLGMLFAYFVVLPLAFQFLVEFTPKGTEYGPDIGDYFSFVFSIFFAFGLAFEMPVAIFILIKTGLVSVQTMQEKRRYVIVGCFAFGMVLTPPDVISQTLLAIPMWLLFEIGLFVAKSTLGNNEVAKIERN